MIFEEQPLYQDMRTSYEVQCSFALRSLLDIDLNYLNYYAASIWPRPSIQGLKKTGKLTYNSCFALHWAGLILKVVNTV